MVGFWLQSTARAYLVYEATGSAAALGGVYLASYGPQLLVAPWAGVAADRWNRRRLVVVTTAGMQVVALLTALLVRVDAASVPVILGVSVVSGVLLTLQSTSSLALLPSLVPRSALSSAVSLQAMSVSGTRVVGPLLAGALLPAIGAAWLFVGQAVTLLPVVAVWCLVSLPARAVVTGVQDRGLRAMSAGLRYICGRRELAVPLSLLAVLCAVGFVYAPLGLAFATDVLSDGDAALGVTRFGLLQGVVGIGALVGVLGMASGGSRRPAAALLGSGAALSLALIALGSVSSLPAALVVSTLLGGAQFANTNVAQVLVQHHAPEELRGRVMAVTQVCTGGLFPFASFGLARLADSIGIPRTYVGCGVVCLLAVLATVPLRHHLRLPLPADLAGGVAARADEPGPHPAAAGDGVAAALAGSGVEAVVPVDDDLDAAGVRVEPAGR